MTMVVCILVTVLDGLQGPSAAGAGAALLPHVIPRVSLRTYIAMRVRFIRRVILTIDLSLCMACFDLHCYNFTSYRYLPTGICM